MTQSWNDIKAARGESAEQSHGYESARRLHTTGDSIRSLRLAMGLTQREVCRRAGVAVSTLSRLESGEAMPTVDVLARISEVVGARLELVLVPASA